MRHRHDGDGRGGEVLPVEDAQLAAARVRVEHEREQPRGPIVVGRGAAEDVDEGAPLDEPTGEPQLVPSPQTDENVGALIDRANAQRPELRGMRAMQAEATTMADLARRERYKYVQPRLERAGRGWKVASPNCSRSVHADGREIDIARLQPEGALWKLYARDHVLGIWVQKGSAMALPQALALLAADPSREFWP